MPRLTVNNVDTYILCFHFWRNVNTECNIIIIDSEMRHACKSISFSFLWLSCTSAVTLTSCCVGINQAHLIIKLYLISWAIKYCCWMDETLCSTKLLFGCNLWMDLNPQTQLWPQHLCSSGSSSLQNPLEPFGLDWGHCEYTVVNAWREPRAVAVSHRMILPLTNVRRRWLSSRNSSAAADAVDTLFSFPWTLEQNAWSWERERVRQATTSHTLSFHLCGLSAHILLLVGRLMADLH